MGKSMIAGWHRGRLASQEEAEPGPGAVRIDPEWLTKDGLREALRAAGIEFASNASRDLLVNLYNRHY